MKNILADLKTICVRAGLEEKIRKLYESSKPGFISVPWPETVLTFKEGKKAKAPAETWEGQVLNVTQTGGKFRFLVRINNPLGKNTAIFKIEKGKPKFVKFAKASVSAKIDDEFEEVIHLKAHEHAKEYDKLAQEHGVKRRDKNKLAHDIENLVILFYENI